MKHASKKAIDELPYSLKVATSIFQMLELMRDEPIEKRSEMFWAGIAYYRNCVIIDKIDVLLELNFWQRLNIKLVLSAIHDHLVHQAEQYREELVSLVKSIDFDATYDFAKDEEL
jgi:hypothetical protein